MVVPCEPGGDPGACLAALRGLPGPEKALIREVIVTWGRHPSRQRNLAVKACRAPWILFLDSDSRVQPGLVQGLLAAAKALDAVAAGGPNLPLEDEGPWGRLFDPVLASWAGSGASRARYSPVGATRLSGEKELILCNLLMRRDAFLASGGFREDLYPNEENELFNRLQAKGGRLAYVPQAQVRRPRRQSPGEFVHQAFRYGRGRAQQMRRNAFASDLVNLAPLGLLLGLLGAAVAGLRWPQAFYLVWAYLGLAWLSQELRPSRALFLVLRHQAYAVGLLAGALQDPTPHEPGVELSRAAWRAR